MKQTLLSLSRLTGKTSEELEGLLNDAGEDEKALTEAFQTAVLDHFMDKERKSKDNFYRKGEKEKARKVEQALQPLFDEYGIAADNIESGAAQLAEKLKEQPAKAGGDGLTPDFIKSQPIFKQALQEATNAIRQEAEKAKADAEKAVQKQAMIEHATDVKERLIPILEDNGANFGADRKMSLQAFFAITPPEKFKVDGGDVFILGDDGEPIQDKWGQPIKAADYLKGNEKEGLPPAWFLGFQQQGTPQTPAPGTRGSTGGQGGKHFNSLAEYQEARAQAAASPTRLAEISKKYLEQVNSFGDLE